MHKQLTGRPIIIGDSKERSVVIKLSVIVIKNRLL